MKFKLNKNKIVRTLKKNSFKMLVGMGGTLKTHLMEEAPKETKNLIQNIKLSKPFYKNYEPTIQVQFLADYTQYQNDKTLMHHPDWRSDKHNKIAKLADRLKLRPGWAYKKTHAAKYSRGLRYLRQGLVNVRPVYVKTDFIAVAKNEYLVRSHDRLLRFYASKIIR